MFHFTQLIATWKTGWRKTSIFRNDSGGGRNILRLPIMAMCLRQPSKKMKLNLDFEMLQLTTYKTYKHVFFITRYSQIYFTSYVATYHGVTSWNSWWFQVMGGDDETFGDSRDGWVTPAGPASNGPPFRAKIAHGAWRKKKRASCFCWGKVKVVVSKISLKNKRDEYVTKWRAFGGNSGFTNWRKIWSRWVEWGSCEILNGGFGVSEI